MAEACGACCRSFLPSREINESLKCACQRPFFSQTVARNNLPTDRDCWIEVPKRFVRHYSSSFGQTVNLEGDDGRSYCCSLVGSDIAFVGYGFEWYNFASSHNVRMGDQVVFTLMEKSRFLVQVYTSESTPPSENAEEESDSDDNKFVGSMRPPHAQNVAALRRQCAAAANPGNGSLRRQSAAAANPKPVVVEVVDEDEDNYTTRADPQTVPLAEVKMEQDVDIQLAGCRDWVQANVIRCGINMAVEVEQYVDDLPANVDGVPLEAHGSQESNDKIAGDVPSLDKTDGQSLQAEAQSEDAKSDNAESEDAKSDNAESENDNVEIDGESASSSSDSDDSSSKGPEREMFGSRKRSEPNNSVESSDDEVSGAAMSEDKSTDPPLLYIPKNRGFPHPWAEPGTTRRKTYVSKRRLVTFAEKSRALEAAKACPITHNSYLRQLEKDSVYRALVLAIPAPWYRKNMPDTKRSYEATLVDEEGNSWQSRISNKNGGKIIVWSSFSLDHRLEEDDVVVMELVDSTLQSLRFLVHIFRVVDVRRTVTGKISWTDHYTVVDGEKTKAHIKLPKVRRLKRKRARASSHLENSGVGQAANSPNKRLTRLQAALQSAEESSANATHGTVDAEHDSEDSLPLKHAKDSNEGGPTLSSGTDSCPSNCRPGSSARAGPSTEQEAESKSGKECIVCWNAPAEAACIPCGHLAGCMGCLTTIQKEGWGCPVCRASIQQVVKVYAV